MKALRAAVFVLLPWVAQIAGCAIDGSRANVVCIGDSITLGEGVNGKENFVSLLGASQSGWRMVNLARSGWSTSTYLARRQEVVSAVPPDATLILVLLGTNDVRERATSDIAGAVVRRLDELTDLFGGRAPGAEIVLMAPPNVYPSRLSARLRRAGFDETSPYHLKLVGDGIRQLAIRKRYRYVDLYAVVTDRNTLDGVHPSAAGHRQISNAILSAVQVMASPGRAERNVSGGPRSR